MLTVFVSQSRSQGIRKLEADFNYLKGYEAITGEMSGKGIAGRLKDVEDYQNKDRKHKWMGLGGALVIGAIAKYWDKFTHLF